LKDIKNCLYFLGSSLILVSLICIFIILGYFSLLDIQSQLLLVFFLLAVAVLVSLRVQGYKKLLAAQLIIENQIIHIQSAVIADKAFDEGEYENVGGIEVFVSNFGILLDSRVIKFNQGGVTLKALELGGHYISLTYGDARGSQQIWILCEPFEDSKIKEIAEKFRYETGVIAKIIDD